MCLSVLLHDSWETLEQWADQWDRWAHGKPFRSWDWVTTWCSIYGVAEPSCRLHVLSVHQGDGALGFAPLFMSWHPFWGWTIRFLGSGEICGDDVGWVAPGELQETVGRAIARALHHGTANACSMVTGGTNGSRTSIRIPTCDQVDLDGVRLSDRGLQGFLQELQGLGWAIDIRPIEHCWQIPLPKTWEEFLQNLPRSFMRKKIRKAQQRYLSPGGVHVHTVFGTIPWEEAWRHLINLHQARRLQLGDGGAFASGRFLRFHQEILSRWLPSGKARLVWLEWQGQAIAAEYLLISEETVRAYQSGMNPQFGHMSPGFLANLAVIQQAITEGYRVFDFLRGDEPYKADWGARPLEMVRIRAVPPRAVPQMRLRLWQTAKACVNVFRKRKHRECCPRLIEHDAPSGEVLSPTAIMDGTTC
mgnify:FL=1